MVIEENNRTFYVDFEIFFATVGLCGCPCIDIFQ